MKSFTFRAAWGLGLALFWSSPLTAADKQGDLMQLRVSVFNFAPISPKAIEHAEGEASRILEDAGVAVIWLNSAQDSQHEVSRGRCTVASFPLHLHLRIARVSRGLKPSTVGISFSAEDGQGCYVDLFYEPIRFSSSTAGREPRIEGKTVRRVVRKTSISENYEGRISHIRSEISRLSGGTERKGSPEIIGVGSRRTGNQTPLTTAGNSTRCPDTTQSFLRGNNGSQHSSRPPHLRNWN